MFGRDKRWKHIKREAHSKIRIPYGDSRKKIWLIGFKWKHGNMWSWEVLIGPSPFYVPCSHYNFCLCGDAVRIYGENMGDLASNRCLYTPWRHLKSLAHLMDINSNNSWRRYYDLVPIALGKYLFPFRTQKSSPVAPIILLCGKLGRCQIMKNHSERGDFFVVENTCGHFEYIRQATAKAAYTALRETRKVPNCQ